MDAPNILIEFNVTGEDKKIALTNDLQILEKEGSKVLTLYPIAETPTTPKNYRIGIKQGPSNQQLALIKIHGSNIELSPEKEKNVALAL